MQKIKFSGEVWFSSDLHLHHRRIQEFCPYTRKGSDVDDMTARIIDNILTTLKPKDTLINLGDFSFGTPTQTRDALKAIHDRGIKHHIVWGNHDHYSRGSEEHKSFFETTNDDVTFTFNKNVFVCHHFPKASWDRMGHGSYHLHGHTHGDYSVEGRIMDVGIDTRAAGDMKPYHISEIVKILENEPFGYHHKRK